MYVCMYVCMYLWVYTCMCSKCPNSVLYWRYIHILLCTHNSILPPPRRSVDHAITVLNGATDPTHVRWVILPKLHWLASSPLVEHPGGGQTLPGVPALYVDPSPVYSASELRKVVTEYYASTPPGEGRRPLLVARYERGKETSRGAWGGCEVGM